MSLLLNGKKINQARLNGKDLKQVNFNGVRIWPDTITITNTKHKYSEDVNTDVWGGNSRDTTIADPVYLEAGAYKVTLNGYLNVVAAGGAAENIYCVVWMYNSDNNILLAEGAPNQANGWMNWHLDQTIEVTNPGYYTFVRVNVGYSDPTGNGSGNPRVEWHFENLNSISLTPV